MRHVCTAVRGDKVSRLPRRERVTDPRPVGVTGPSETLVLGFHPFTFTKPRLKSAFLEEINCESARFFEGDLTDDDQLVYVIASARRAQDDC